MALTLTVLDAEDGTGGTATVAGSDPGAAVSLFRARFAGAVGPAAWTLVGTRTGNGPIAATAGVGYYFWQAVSTVGGLAAFASYYRPVTDAAEQSDHEQILDAAVAKLQALNLPGVQSTRIEFKWLPRKLQKGVDPLPQVQVIPAGGETFPGMLLNKDDVGYPVMIVVLDAQDDDFKKNKRRNLLWRSKILKAFRYQKLAGAPGVWNCQPEQMTVMDSVCFKELGIFASFIGLRFINRELRGA